MTFFGWFRRTAPNATKPKPRDVSRAERARQEAWGPITDETRQVDRQRIADQKARDFGAGQLFGK